MKKRLTMMLYLFIGLTLSFTIGHGSVVALKEAFVFPELSILLLITGSTLFLVSQILTIFTIVSAIKYDGFETGEDEFQHGLGMYIESHMES